MRTYQQDLRGLIASRPAAAIRGRQYYATDENVLYYDTGISWMSCNIGEEVGDVRVRRNSVIVGTRSQLNLIEGSNITLTMTDDTSIPEVTCTIASAIANNSVTDAQLRDSAATSVIGRSAGTTGDPADIAASADGQYLGRTGGSIRFGAIATTDLPAAAVLDSEANTYTAGAKQTVQNSVSTAGLNLASSADPSTLAQGDIWINASDLKFRGATTTQTVERQVNKAAASGYPSLDSSTLVPVAQLGTGVATSSNFLRGDRTWEVPGGGGGGWTAPAWAGKIAGAYGNGDPGQLFQMIQRGTVVAPTPTNITASVARCCAFRLQDALTVNRIRFYGVGATTGIYRVAIYRYSDGARLAVINDFNTAAATWGNLGSALGLVLAAGTLYYIAVAVDTTGTTAGIAAWGTTIAAATGQIATAPQSLPGNLDFDAGFINGYTFQFAVTSGALPATAPTLAAQAAWTGGMPAFWLDNADL